MSSPTDPGAAVPPIAAAPATTSTVKKLYLAFILAFAFSLILGLTSQGSIWHALFGGSNFIAIYYAGKLAERRSNEYKARRSSKRGAAAPSPTAAAPASP